MPPRKGRNQRNIMLLVKELHAVYDVLNDAYGITGEKEIVTCVLS